MDNQNIIDRFFAKREAQKTRKRFYITAKVTVERLCVADVEASSLSEAKKQVSEMAKSGGLNCQAEELKGIEFLQISDLSKANPAAGGEGAQPAAPEAPSPEGAK